MKSFGITIHPLLAKFILWLNTSNRFMIVCCGYNEDDENFTELVREDDQGLDFFDKDSYPEFQLWVFP